MFSFTCGRLKKFIVAEQKSGKYISETELRGIELDPNWTPPLKEPCKLSREKSHQRSTIVKPMNHNNGQLSRISWMVQ